MIEQYDGPLRFLVPSDQGGETRYLVDLGENGIIGKCACPHFEKRMQPIIDEEKDAGSNTDETLGKSARCKHIVLARDHFTDNLVRQFNALEKTPPPSIT